MKDLPESLPPVVSNEDVAARTLESSPEGESTYKSR